MIDTSSKSGTGQGYTFDKRYNTLAELKKDNPQAAKLFQDNADLQRITLQFGGGREVIWIRREK